MVEAGFVATQASTGLLVALGLVVLLARPRTRTSVAFSAVAIGIGVGIFAINGLIAWGPSLSDALFGLLCVFVAASFLPVIAAGLLIVRVFPRPLGTSGRAFMALPATAGALGALVGAGSGWLPELAELVGLEGLSWRRFAYSAAEAIEVAGLGVLMGAAAVFGLRYAATASAQERAQYALMGAGLGVAAAASAGAYVVSPIDGMRIFGVFMMAGSLMILASWLWATRRGSAKGARNVCVLVSLFALAGIVLGSTIGDRSIDDTGWFGVGRLLSFVIFGYGILRHQLLGVDVKVRWTLSKGTVASVIVATFLVGSQAVQNVTNEEFGIWGGALLAGLALFALGPLQAAADRLARRMVPVGDGAAGSHEPTYIGAVRMALRGGISPEEELTLTALARDLGLDPVRAVQLRRDAEAAAGAPSRRLQS